MDVRRPSDTRRNELARDHPKAIKFIETHFPTKKGKDHDGKKIEVYRNAKTTWKAFYCQQFEAISRAVKIEYCEANSTPYGPTKHDGIAISKTHNDGRPVGFDSKTVADELTRAVSEKLGFEVVVEVKPMHPTPVIDETRFTAAMFSLNPGTALAAPHTTRGQGSLFLVYADLVRCIPR